MMQCAPGSKLSNNYIGGSSNPCTQRYFKLRATTCVRPGPVITVSVKLNRSQSKLA